MASGRVISHMSSMLAVRDVGGDGHSRRGLPATDILAMRFDKLDSLNERERMLLRLIEGKAKHSHRANSKLLDEKAEIRRPHFIVSGWAARVRELKDGRRQIVSVLLPGDAIGLSNRTSPLSLTTVLALTPMRTVEAPEVAVAWRDRDRVPALSAVLDLAAAEEEFFMLAHIMRLGRQTAYERIAHWFMELEYRLSSRGLSTNGSFPLPLTQETIAHTVGLSVVHVNRTLQQMRKEARIELTRGRLSLLDKEALCEAGEFIPPVLSASDNARQAAKSADAAISV
jgi:CRP-like cAMP-binding protein